MDNYNIFYLFADGRYCYDLIIYDEFLAVSLKISGMEDIRELGNIGIVLWFIGVSMEGLTVGYHEFGNLYFLLIPMLHLLLIF